MIHLEKIEAINAIEELKKYQTETNKIEAKKALDGFPKNVMIPFQVFLINMVELLYLV